jgi:short subunit dehydrogenase-like uncharacterized protein
MPRDFDVILYGASGFTGRQTVAYFAQHAPSGLRWAIAGRNRAKLEALNSGVTILTADAADPIGIDALVQRTQVLLTTAGPFAIYGTRFVDACVRFNTHYVDITGETPWVRMLIDRYDAKAAAQGTRIIPFCGFDSVPSDLGAMLISEALGPETTQVKTFFEMRASLNGGTLASAINMYESGAMKAFSDLFVLSPTTTRAPRDIEQDPRKASYDADMKTWTAPFVMGAINTRVVRRSCALRCTDFAYQEYAKVSSHFAATVLATGGAMFERALHSKSMRSVIRAFSPSPGEGPSKKTMDSGWFRCHFFGKTGDGRTAQGLISDQGDPGNRVTVKCLCESALTLALDPLPDRAGVLTPSTGLGTSLITRLRATGMNITF